MTDTFNSKRLLGSKHASLRKRMLEEKSITTKVVVSAVTKETASSSVHCRNDKKKNNGKNLNNYVDTSSSLNKVMILPAAVSIDEEEISPPPPPSPKPMAAVESLSKVEKSGDLKREKLVAIIDEDNVNNEKSYEDHDHQYKKLNESRAQIQALMKELGVSFIESPNNSLNITTNDDPLSYDTMRHIENVMDSSLWQTSLASLSTTSNPSEQQQQQHSKSIIRDISDNTTNEKDSILPSSISVIKAFDESPVANNSKNGSVPSAINNDSMHEYIERKNTDLSSPFTSLGLSPLKPFPNIHVNNDSKINRNSMTITNEEVELSIASNTMSNRNEIDHTLHTFEKRSKTPESASRMDTSLMQPTSPNQTTISILRERNASLLKEIRFAEQTCVELSHVKQQQEQRIQMLQQRLVDERDTRAQEMLNYDKKQNRLLQQELLAHQNVLAKTEEHHRASLKQQLSQHELNAQEKLDTIIEQYEIEVLSEKRKVQDELQKQYKEQLQNQRKQLQDELMEHHKAQLHTLREQLQNDLIKQHKEQLHYSLEQQRQSQLKQHQIALELAQQEWKRQVLQKEEKQQKAENVCESYLLSHLKEQNEEQNCENKELKAHVESLMKELQAKKFDEKERIFKGTASNSSNKSIDSLVQKYEYENEKLAERIQNLQHELTNSQEKHAIEMKELVQKLSNAQNVAKEKTDVLQEKLSLNQEKLRYDKFVVNEKYAEKQEDGIDNAKEQLKDANDEITKLRYCLEQRDAKQQSEIHESVLLLQQQLKFKEKELKEKSHQMEDKLHQLKKGNETVLAKNNIYLQQRTEDHEQKQDEYDTLKSMLEEEKGRVLLQHQSELDKCELEQRNIFEAKEADLNEKFEHKCRAFQTQIERKEEEIHLIKQTLLEQEDKSWIQAENGSQLYKEMEKHQEKLLEKQQTDLQKYEDELEQVKDLYKTEKKENDSVRETHDQKIKEIRQLHHEEMNQQRILLEAMSQQHDEQVVQLNEKFEIEKEKFEKEKITLLQEFERKHNFSKQCIELDVTIQEQDEQLAQLIEKFEREKKDLKEKNLMSLQEIRQGQGETMEQQRLEMEVIIQQQDEQLVKLHHKYEREKGEFEEEKNSLFQGIQQQHEETLNLQVKTLEGAIQKQAREHTLIKENLEQEIGMIREQNDTIVEELQQQHQKASKQQRKDFENINNEQEKFFLLQAKDFEREKKSLNDQFDSFLEELQLEHQEALEKQRARAKLELEIKQREKKVVGLEEKSKEKINNSQLDIMLQQHEICIKQEKVELESKIQQLEERLVEQDGKFEQGKKKVEGEKTSQINEIRQQQLKIQEAQQVEQENRIGKMERVLVQNQEKFDRERNLLEEESDLRLQEIKQQHVEVINLKEKEFLQLLSHMKDEMSKHVQALTTNTLSRMQNDQLRIIELTNQVAQLSSCLDFENSLCSEAHTNRNSLDGRDIVATFSYSEGSNNEKGCENSFVNKNRESKNSINKNETSSNCSSNSSTNQKINELEQALASAHDDIHYQLGTITILEHQLDNTNTEYKEQVKKLQLESQEKFDRELHTQQEGLIGKYQAEIAHLKKDHNKLISQEKDSNQIYFEEQQKKYESDLQTEITRLQDEHDLLSAKFKKQIVELESESEEKFTKAERLMNEKLVDAEKNNREKLLEAERINEREQEHIEEQRLQFQGELRNIVDDLKKLQAAKKGLQTQRDHLQSQLSQKSLYLKQANEENETLRNELELSAQALEKAQKNCVNLTKQCDMMNLSLEDVFEQQIHDKVQFNQKLQQSMKHQRCQLDEQANQKLQQAMKLQNQLEEQLEKTNLDLEETRRENKQLELQLKGKTTSLEQAMKEGDDTERKLENSLQQADEQCEYLESQLNLQTQSLVEECEHLESQLNDQTLALEDAMEHCKFLESQLEQETQSLLQVADKVNFLEAQVNQQNHSMEKTLNERDNFEKRLGDQTFFLGEAIQERDNLETKLNVESQNLRKSEEHCKYLEIQLTEHIKASAEALEQRDNCEIQMKQQEKELKKLIIHRDELEQKTSITECEVDRLQSLLKNAENEISQLKAAYLEGNEKLATAFDEMAKNEILLKKFKESSERAVKVSEQVIESTNAEFNSKINTIKEEYSLTNLKHQLEIDEFKQQKDELEENCKDTAEACKLAKQERDMAISDLKMAEEKLEDQLDQLCEERNIVEVQFQDSICARDEELNASLSTQLELEKSISSITQERESLKSDLKLVHQQNSELNTQIFTISEELETRQSERDDVHKQNTVLQVKHRKNSTEIEKLKDKLATETKESQKELAQYKNRFEVLNKENDKVCRELQHFQESLSSSDAQLASANQKCNDESQKLRESQLHMQQVENKRKELEVVICKLKEELENATKQEKDLSLRVKEAEKSAEISNSEFVAYKQCMEGKINERQVVLREFQDISESKQQKLRDELVVVKESNSVILTEIANEIESFRSMLDSMMQKSKVLMLNASFECTIMNSASKGDTWKTKLDQAKLLVTVLYDSLSLSSDELVERHQIIENLRKQFDESQAELQMYQQEKKQQELTFEKQQQSLQKLQRQLSEAENEVKDVSSEVVNSSKDLLEANKALDSLKEAYMEQSYEVDNLTQERDNAHKKLNFLTSKLQEYTSAHNGFGSHSNVSETKLLNYKGKTEKLKSQVQLLESKNEKLRKYIRKLTSKCEEWQTNWNEQQNMLADFNDPFNGEELYKVSGE